LPEDRFEPWADEHRERLQSRYAQLLIDRARNLIDDGELVSAAQVLERSISLDPFDERAVGELMRCYAAAGQRHLALARYAQLEARLADGLGVGPGPQLRWVRAQVMAGRLRLGEELIADSRRALVHVQYGPGLVPRSFLPTYYLPAGDVVSGVLVDPVEDAAGFTVWTVAAGDRRAQGAAWAHRAPPPPLAALAGLVTFSWSDPLTWWEEDETLLAHARDPHKRVDVVASSRRVRVEVDGELLADSRRPLLLFETLMPVRYYLPPEDVRVELVPSETTSMCPYKGIARWWSARGTHRSIEDIAWSYPSPIAENPRIAGLICFRNERVDLTVDGQGLDRPLTPWS